jgi:hypothetical protein
MRACDQLLKAAPPAALSLSQRSLIFSRRLTAGILTQMLA